MFAKIYDQTTERLFVDISTICCKGSINSS